MALSVAPMALADLAAYLVSAGEYATISEAMAALNIVIVDGVGAAGTAIAVSGGAASTAVGTVGETALELAARSQLQATGTGVATAGIGVMQGAAGFNISALLGMPVGIAAAAIAPYYGVKLGEAMYESNPELWTKLSQKLLPFCYPGTTQIPTWAEIAESTWIVSVAKDVVDAVKELFDEEEIGADEGMTSDLDTAFDKPIKTGGGYQYTLVGEDHIVSVAGSTAFSWDGRTTNAEISFIGTSAVPVSRITFYMDNSSVYYTNEISTYTYNGKTVYYGTGITRGPSYVRSVANSNSPFHFRFSDEAAGRIAWTIQYGTPVGGFPDGTARWTGNIPSTIPEAKPAVTGIDSTGRAITTPTVPICPPIIIIPDPIIEPQPVPQLPPAEIPFPWPKPATVPAEEPWPEVMPWPLPATEPEWWPTEIPYPDTYPYQYPSADPEVQPDPSTVTKPDEQVEPYILPSPYPYTLPVPETKPITNTDANPANPTKPTIKIDTQPPTELGPDPIGISPTPVMPGTELPFDLSQNVGLVTVYHPTAAQLYSFERWLWVTYADASIDKIFNNPFDGVITLFELYCTPTDVGNQNIRSGFLDSGINSAVISRYTEIDCGTLGIPEYYGNYFDYSPYSKAHVYLPFIGIQELNVDDIVGHAVNIKYRIDEYNGACIAMITVAKVTEVNGEPVEYSNTTYQFSGNCSVELPLAGGTQAAIKAGMMQANAWQTAANVSAGVNLVGGVASILGAAATGSVGAAMGGVSQGLGSIGGFYSGKANYLSNMLSGKSTVAKSGQFGASHGALGIKTPFITVTRPKQIAVPNYNELYGYPAHKMVYVGDCKGYLRCREVHVVSATATDDEKAAIEQLLVSGVYVTEE